MYNLAHIVMAQELPWTEVAPQLPYYQPSEEYVEGLEAKPWHDPTDFPWVEGLEQATPIIREELEKVRDAHARPLPVGLRRPDSDGAGNGQVLGEGVPSDFKADSNVQAVMGTGWTAMRLQRLGQWNDDVCAIFPRTVAVRHRLC